MGFGLGPSFTASTTHAIVGMRVVCGDIMWCGVVVLSFVIVMLGVVWVHCDLPPAALVI